MSNANPEINEEDLERLKQIEARKERAERARPTAMEFVDKKTVGGYIRSLNDLPPTTTDVGLQESPLKPELRDRIEEGGGDRLTKSSLGVLVPALFMVGCSLAFLGFIIYKMVH